MSRSKYLWHFGFWTVMAVLILSGINPEDRFTWMLENAWIFAGLAVVAWLRFRGTPLTQLLGWAIFFYSLFLIYGGYYTYEKTPLGNWMMDSFGFTRNNYDRIGHVLQGFVPAILYREVFYRNRVVNGKGWLEAVVFACCMAFTAIFEIIEFATALCFGGASALYLGSQGDVWDAQWDMVCCGIGAIISIVLLSGIHRRQLHKIIKK